MADAMKLVPVSAFVMLAEQYERDSGQKMKGTDWYERVIAASPPAREEAPADDGPVFHMNLLSHEDNEAWLASARKQAPAEGAGDLTRGQIINAICNASPFGPDYKHPDLLRMSDAILALRDRTSEPEAGAVAWIDFKPGSYPPLNGEWFVAKCPQAVRVVHYADKGDRLPIDHTGWAWPSLPTHWMRLRDYTHPAPATADKLQVAKEALEPFAKYPLATRRDGSVAEDEHQLTGRIGPDGFKAITNADFLRARQALAALNEQPQ